MEERESTDKWVPDIQAGKASEVPVCRPKLPNPVKLTHGRDSRVMYLGARHTPGLKHFP